jgi:acetyl esterase/lipase
MALIHWPQEFSFFQYLRLKALVSLIRVLVKVVTFRAIRRDRLIAHKDVRKERVRIPSRDTGCVILADVYYPPGYTSSSPTHVLVNWHGSGFIIPCQGFDMLWCTTVAHEAGVVVVDGDYRKSPEHPFPAAPNDVEDTLRWVAEQGGFDAKRVAMSGLSADGCLALVAASTLRRKLAHLLDIRAAVAFYPWPTLQSRPRRSWCQVRRMLSQPEP